MKKIIFSLTVFIFTISNPIISHAAQTTPNTQQLFLEKTVLEHGITVEHELTVLPSNARSNSKTATKTSTYKADGKVIATIKLSADFTYTGSSATCTRASSSYSMSDGWSYSNRTTTRSGNTATTSAKISKYNEYFNANVTITCSGSGDIS